MRLQRVIAPALVVVALLLLAPMAQKKPSGLTGQGLAAKELAEKDIVVFANMKTARERIVPALQKGRAEFIRNFEQGMNMMNQPPRARGARGGPAANQPGGLGAAPASQPGQKFMPVIRTLVGRFFDV